MKARASSQVPPAGSDEVEFLGLSADEAKDSLAGEARQSGVPPVEEITLSDDEGTESQGDL